MRALFLDKERMTDIQSEWSIACSFSKLPFDGSIPHKIQKKFTNICARLQKALWH
jgi:hypothetical protein